MRILALAFALCAAPRAFAQETVSPKWTLAPGDRFSLEISCEFTDETYSDKRWNVTTTTLKLSTRLDVLEFDEGKATIELTVLGTKGKRVSNRAGVKAVDLTTVAKDWELPVPGVILKDGNLCIDTKRVPMPAQLSNIEYFYALFTVLPKGPVKLNEKWTVGIPDARYQEVLQVTSLAVEATETVAKVEGILDTRTENVSDKGEKVATYSHKGTSKSEFDVQGGYLKSRESTLVSERTDAGKKTPSARTTRKRSVVLKRLEPAKK